MHPIQYQGRPLRCRDNESLLDALVRTGVAIDFSCKSGVCRRCLVKVVDGAAPAEAARSLPPHLRSAGYVLACQCKPAGPLSLAPKSPADMLTPCMLVRREHGADGSSGLWLRGPFPVEPEGEAPLPAPNLALWHLLDHGRLVRRVLEAFYQKVYADPLLQPFFERVSMERVIGKQYAFLMQCMTGDKVYIGERPKNAHHWMVIPDMLFEHRQRLMAQAQREQGLTPEQMAGWALYEEHFRADIVKHAPWPKRMGDQAIETERYDTVTLDEATVCDHCGAEIAANSTVRFHVRLGQVGCQRCERG
ncbi:MAG: hypothetical protein A2W72_13620 [Burkholderiales bacterium RIFCSPLOWO2_12_67_14]|nr:MAG: hypothetical protein A3I64_04520 [Burkholderiales bacterium RIFCSPLOWO2_02_FULL_67_64]OGB38476.1 MAG: hypothetical protein A3E51_02535 [Burkholderiales bacterium RIFCSPHIGHO2_12_FULL_67_38]OGB46347.1 MAG: hypothetical protein A2W72_13620 [Burkholderiales bacterium RIFCSPLOWO2_12_67_14]